MTVDNIGQGILDKLKEMYEGRENFRVTDSRDEVSFGRKRGYFLFGFMGYSDKLPQFTFIWIGNNLWQYRYMNTHCDSVAQWKSPEELLRQLLDDEQ